jgi:signal peptidase I
VRRAIEATAVALLVVLFLTTFVVRTYYIPSISMIPTLQIGDVVLANMLAYHLHAPRENDLGLFTPPVREGSEPFVKRVIGVPGDTIRIADGIVYRNGKALDEPYENQPPDYDLAIKNYGISVDNGTGIMEALSPRDAVIPPKNRWQAPNRIPEGFYFVLGDNRRYSRDSHVWGFVSQNAFIGNAFATLWPLNHVRIF